MSKSRGSLEAEAAALAVRIAKAEVFVAELRQDYWLKIHEIHSLGVKPKADVADAIGAIRQGLPTADGVFALAKGAVTRDDT